MKLSVAASRLKSWEATPGGRTRIRYVLSSVITVGLGVIVLTLCFGSFGWSARSSNYVAFVATGIPSYYLNRAWAWGKTGRSHLLREVLPFWIIAFSGLLASTWSVDFADTQVRVYTGSRVVRTGAVLGATIVVFGVIWLAKFVILNRYLFAERVLPASTEG